MSTRVDVARSDTDGAALVFVLLAILALVGLGHGLLVGSLGELSAARAGERHLLSRMASEAVVHLAFRAPARAWTDSVPVGGSHAADSIVLGRARGLSFARRLSLEAWLLEGVGSVGSSPGVREGRLAWALDAVARVTSLQAVLSVAPRAALLLDGSVDASAPTRLDPPLDEADCDPWLPELQAHFEAAPWGIAAPAVDSATGPGLGLLAFDELMRRAEVTVSGAGTPQPLERAGACISDDPWGWGDPDRPWRPCGQHLAVRGAPAGLTVMGGVGQGVLVVAGDLLLTAGARFYGLAMVHGALVLEEGSRLTGAAMASGGVRVSADAAVVGSACWAARALAGEPGTLRRLIPVPGVPAIGPL